MGAILAGAFIFGAAKLLEGLEASRAFGADAASLEAEARATLEAGRLAGAQARQTGRRIQGEIINLTGAAGLELSGSPLAVAVDQAVQTDRIARTILFMSEQRAASLFEQARQLRRAGRRAGFTSILSTAGGFLGAAGAGAFRGGGAEPQGGGSSSGSFQFGGGEF